MAKNVQTMYTRSWNVTQVLHQVICRNLEGTFNSFSDLLRPFPYILRPRRHLRVLTYYCLCIRDIEDINVKNNIP